MKCTRLIQTEFLDLFSQIRGISFVFIFTYNKELRTRKILRDKNESINEMMNPLERSQHPYI